MWVVNELKRCQATFENRMVRSKGKMGLINFVLLVIKVFTHICETLTSLEGVDPQVRVEFNEIKYDLIKRVVWL